MSVETSRSLPLPPPPHNEQCEVALACLLNSRDSGVRYSLISWYFRVTGRYWHVLLTFPRSCLALGSKTQTSQKKRCPVVSKILLLIYQDELYQPYCPLYLHQIRVVTSVPWLPTRINLASKFCFDVRYLIVTFVCTHKADAFIFRTMKYIMQGTKNSVMFLRGIWVAGPIWVG